MESEATRAPSSPSRRRELDAIILQKVAEISSSIDAAKNVDDVIRALHSLALRLFPVDSLLLSGANDEGYGSQALDIDSPTDSERDEWRHVFYQGAAFPTVARILIYNVASNWLARFPLSARKQVYDSFFVKGPSSEVIQTLVPALARNVTDEKYNHNVVCSNIERLLVLCLLENGGINHMVEEFLLPCSTDKHADEVLKQDQLKCISRAAQLLASIPDKARPKASSALSSHLFFRQVAIQLLVGAERVLELCDVVNDSDVTTVDAAFLFVGETFSRITRRGSADILLLEMIPKILNFVRSCLSTNVDSMISNFLESNPKSRLWLKMMESMKDKYAVERLSEELLRQLATENITDVEAYWILWLLFQRTFRHQTVIRAMFIEKFLLWKVFPLCCLRWIVQFAVLECPANDRAMMEGSKTKGFPDIVQRLVVIWSKREFVQSAPMEQQAYITAAIGLCVEKMSKEELETTKDVLHSILQGVSCRLESPIHLVRKMASSVALVFSKVVDPKNPLYLDDDSSETVDWELGLIPQPKKPSATNRISATGDDESQSSLCKHKDSAAMEKRKKVSNDKPAQGNNKVVKHRPDHCVIVDPALLSSEHLSDEEDNDDGSEVSEASSDASLQPYDISDDDADLQKNISQLADISIALRKPDDPDGVERALDVAERLIRASPDELRHISGDLVMALVHVRCSDVTIEGDEESAEGKRQKALVALLVTCPFESLNVVTKLLYSPNVDVGQRIMILDVMAEAAQELADSRYIRTNYQQKDLISTISGNPWFIPSSRGPPGAGSWKEVTETGTSLSWSHRYERVLPSRPGQIKKGKSRRWSLGTSKSQQEGTKNKFPLYAAAFMLPAMEGFDKRRQGVDLLNRDFIVLGKLIYMLGVCMKCMAMHPEASALAPALLDMLRSREVANHAEAYVRRSVLFTTSCILAALHPSYVASALIEGNHEISNGLEWIRTWALRIAESDPDTECSGMAMRCLQLHAEMALETSRSLESASSLRSKTVALPSKTNDIKIIMPFSNLAL